MTRKRLSFQLKKAKEILSSLPEIAGAYLLGSYGQGLEHRGSDIDIGLVFKDKGVLEDSLNLRVKYYKLLASLFEDIKKNQEIDIVFLQSVPLTLRKEAINNGRLFYIRDPEKIINFEEETRRDYQDLAFLLKGIREENIKGTANYA